MLEVTPGHPDPVVLRNSTSLKTRELLVSSSLEIEAAKT
jgi:hypothetical protein